MIDGTLFSRHTPPEILGNVAASGFIEPLPRTPRYAKPDVRDEYEAAFNLRARWRFTRHAAPDARGAARWICPFHAKRLRARAFPASMTAARSRPFVHVDASDAACCDGTVTAEADEMPLWQRFPYGTTAWRMAYNRRNVVEGVNSALQSQFTSLQKGYTNVRSLSKLNMLVAFTAAGFNMQTAASFRRKQAAQARRCPRKTKTWGVADHTGGEELTA